MSVPFIHLDQLFTQPTTQLTGLTPLAQQASGHPEVIFVSVRAQAQANHCLW